MEMATHLTQSDAGWAYNNRMACVSKVTHLKKGLKGACPDPPPPSLPQNQNLVLS